jgi:hypothetical protein
MTQRINIQNTKKETILLYDVVFEDLLKEISNLKGEGFTTIEGIDLVTVNSNWGNSTIYYQYMSKDDGFRPKQPAEVIKIIMADIDPSNQTQ